MAKTLYDGVSGVARKIVKVYDGVNGIARRIQKAYDGVAGVARMYFEGLYYWNRYKSQQTGSKYNNYETKSTYYSVQIWKPVELNGVVVWNEEENYGDGHKYYDLIYYNSFDYSNNTGQFSLHGKSTAGLSTFASFSNYEIESYFIVKYLLINGSVYKITGHDDVRSLICEETYVRGSLYYTYSYYLDGEVSSEDPNAYPNESVSNYNSSSSGDIRTKYVKK